MRLCITSAYFHYWLMSRRHEWNVKLETFYLDFYSDLVYVTFRQKCANMTRFDWNSDYLCVFGSNLMTRVIQVKRIENLKLNVSDLPSVSEIKMTQQKAES